MSEMSRAKEKAYIITERRLNDLANRLTEAISEVIRGTNANVFEIIIAFHAALLRAFEFSLEKKREHTR